METDEQYSVVENQGQRSALEKFASWFHQDWKLMFGNFNEGAAMYVARISETERSVLKDELSSFLQSFEADEEEEMRQAWIRLGAQAWPPDRPLSEVLHEFLDAL